MAAKAEAPPAKAEAPAKGDAPAAAAAAAAAHAAPAAARSGLGAWIPVIAALVLAPVITFATVEFVLVPRLQKKLAAAAAGELPAEAEHSAPAESSGGHGKEGKEGKEGGSPNFEFSNVVVNLAGTMGTRYLKTTFIVTGVGDANIKGVFDGAKPRLTDVTLNVLSSLTLSDLEEPGAKNVIREKLVNAYNQALGKKIADQVYFSDFVIQ